MNSVLTRVRLAAACALAVALSACATLSDINSTASAGIQLGIQEAAALAIQANCSATPSQSLAQCYLGRALVLKNIVAVLNTAATVPGTTVASLQAAMAPELAKLTPEQSIPISIVLGQVFTYLQSQIGTGVLNAAQLSIVATVNGWLTSTCALYGA